MRPNAEETRLNSQYSLIISLNCIITNDSKDNEDGPQCFAYGELYMSQNMSILFKANHKGLTVKVNGDDYDVFCDANKAIWANIIREISIYGFDEDINNYDHHKEATLNLDLCRLQNEEANELIYEFNA